MLQRHHGGFGAYRYEEIESLQERISTRRRGPGESAHTLQMAGIDLVGAGKPYPTALKFVAVILFMSIC
jgi:hypothetical protein